MSVASIGLPRQYAQRWHLREIGLWAFLGTIVMLFAAFTSAYVVRKSGSDWRNVPLPPLLWINTAVLAASSVALEQGRRRKEPDLAASGAIAAACGLAVIFFAGQIEAWRRLAAVGVYLPTNPASSFFYLMTGLHGVHMLAAFVVLLYLLVTTMNGRAAEHWRERAGLASTFWHFLTGVWIYLLLVLTLA